MRGRVNVVVRTVLAPDSESPEIQNENERGRVNVVVRTVLTPDSESPEIQNENERECECGSENSLGS